MEAALLRACLISLGSKETSSIEYIELDYGKTDWLDNVCNAINSGSTLDKARTEAQPDACIVGGASMYPSTCDDGWLGKSCTNGCGNKNYNGFYCTSKYSINTSNKPKAEFFEILNFNKHIM